MHCTLQFFLLHFAGSTPKEGPTHTPGAHRACWQPVRSSRFGLRSGAAFCICLDAWVVFRAGAKEHTLQQFSRETTDVVRAAKAGVGFEIGSKPHLCLLPPCHPQNEKVILAQDAGSLPGVFLCTSQQASLLTSPGLGSLRHKIRGENAYHLASSVLFRSQTNEVWGRKRE